MEKRRWQDREGTEYLREIDEYRQYPQHQAQGYRRASSQEYYADLSGPGVGTDVGGGAGGPAYYPREMYDGYRYTEDQIPRSARGQPALSRDGQGRKNKNDKVKKHSW